MRKLLYLGAALAGSAGFALADYGASASPAKPRPSVTALRVEKPPVIDGVLDETVWLKAPAAGDFTQLEPKDGVPMTERTEFRILYSDEALYIGFVGHDDDPADLLAFVLNEDEDLWYDDIVEIYMDADLDHQSYVHMGINSLGVLADAWHPNGLGDQDEAWDADIDIGARVGDAEWSLELAIHFDQQRLPRPQSGQVWGFNFVRTYRGSEYSQWVRTFATGGHSPDDFGFLLFSRE